MEAYLSRASDKLPSGGIELGSEGGRRLWRYQGRRYGWRRITTYVQSNAAVKATHIANLAPIEMPIRAIERNELRRTLAAALMCHPYSEDVQAPHNHRLGDTSSDQERSPPEHRRTLWNRLPQMDVAAALPHWTDPRIVNYGSYVREASRGDGAGCGLGEIDSEGILACPVVPSIGGR